MKAVLAGAVIVGGLVAGAIPALADTISIPQTGVISESPGKSFTYDFDYTVPAGGVSIDGVAGSSSSTTQPKGKTLNLTFSSVMIFATAPGSTTPISIFSDNGGGNGLGHSFSDPTGGLVVAAGTTIDVRYMGSVLAGKQAGAFNGNLTVSSVPLPTSVALFGTALLGLGVVGAAVRKSSAAKAA